MSSGRLRVGLRVLVFTNVGQGALDAYCTPLAALDEVGEILIVRDRPDVRLGPKWRLVTLPRWWPGWKLARLLGRPWVLARAARHRPPDLMMMFHWFPDGPAVLRTARRLRVPVVVNIIGGRAELIDGGRRLALSRLPQWLRRRAQEYQRARLDATAAVTCTGTATQQWFREAGVTRPSIRVLHAAIDGERFFDRGGHRELDVVFVGRVHPDKRLDRLFRVLATLGRRRPGTRVAIVGVSERSAIAFREFAEARTALGGGLQCLGRVDCVSDVMQRAKLLLLTSDTEGRALAMLEGMACGAVPVVTDVGDLREGLDGGRAGVLVPLGRDEAGLVESLASEVLGLLASEPTRAELARHGRQWVRWEHDAARTRAEWRTVIAECVARGYPRCGSS